MSDLIHQLLEKHGRLHLPVSALTRTTNLYDVGLTPLTAIKVLLALEDDLGVEFPQQALRRQNFATIASIADCLAETMRSEPPL